ncbi:MAG: lipopolysaccharide heptosyltransferase family protein [Sphingobacteriia bacterium]|nr:MAG: lipopolysaccharide heptosyltransferase family protein [Sphingobacteriia bacterium]TAH09344.1 MAG: lipopolysaccharide heptosyltransferase family protein [Sphingobacteriia bacterium]
MINYLTNTSNQLKGILYDLILAFASIGNKQSATKKLLIVRVDEIGDYILWRNFFAEIVSYYQQRHYEVHFIGNKSWKTLFELFDKKNITQDYWLDKTKFKKNLRYRYNLLRAINQNGYETVVNPTFSRDKRNDDAIVKAAKALFTIGMKSNTESVRSYEMGYDKKLYTTLYNLTEKPVFEFYRNKLFTEFIVQQASNKINTALKKELLPPNPISLTGKYFIVFPGSRSPQRIWPVAYFIEVCKFLYEKYGLTAVLCGSVADISYTNAFAQNYPYDLVNMAEKTTLPEMLSLLSKAECLISVDTGSVHLAASVACPVFGIFNGSQYKRFAPYPKEVSKCFFTAYPTKIADELKDEELIKSKYEFLVSIPYSSIEPAKVIQLISDNL